MIKLARTGLAASRVSYHHSYPDEPDCSTAAAFVNYQDNSGRESAEPNDEYTPVSSSVLSNQSVLIETVYIKLLFQK
ncbi:hypothetical protein TNCV_9341 [Trichonephila clavipes]|nr:hypothetical protein TNCV_9341 [Trichonephila clavipes]